MALMIKNFDNGIRAVVGHDFKFVPSAHSQKIEYEVSFFVGNEMTGLRRHVKFFDDEAAAFLFYDTAEDQYQPIRQIQMKRVITQIIEEVAIRPL